VTWKEYTDVLERLHNQVMLRNFEGIIGIGRGGSIIAAYMASKLGLPTFYPLFVRHVGRGKDMKIVASDLGQVKALDQVKSLRGRLLVVDDWLCDGRAMKYVLDHMSEEAQVTTLVLFNRRGSEFKPDFVGAYVEEKEREIMFPYDALG
jgi:hypoxanthine phosphoribosyltransferase